MSSGRKRTFVMSHSDFYMAINEIAKSKGLVSDEEWVTEIEELYTLGEVTIHVTDNEHS